MMVSPVGFVPKSPTLVSPEACLVITRVMGLKLMSAGLHRALEEVFMSLDTQHRGESAPVLQNMDVGQNGRPLMGPQMLV